MSGRKPEEISNMIEVVQALLPHSGTLLTHTRLQGVVEGLKYAAGDELPEDIQPAIQFVDRLSQPPLDHDQVMKMLGHPSTRIQFMKPSYGE